MIKIHPEPMDMGVKEPCCFCRQPTIFWSGVSPEDRDMPVSVAICPRCASVVEAKDLPAKSAWCARERIVANGLRRDMTRTLMLNLLPETVPCPHYGCHKGAIDTGGVDSSGKGISEACPQCKGMGIIETIDCIDELVATIV